MESTGSTPKFSEFDYIVMDSNGIVGVKGEERVSITREEWDRAHPEHRNTDCKECTFVQDKESLLVFMVPREKRDRATSEPEFVGKFTMAKWTGHAAFYLFKCLECGKVIVDYAHGYTGPGYLYLTCGSCGDQKILDSRKYKAIYKMDGMSAPPSFLTRLKTIWMLRKSRKSAKLES